MILLDQSDKFYRAYSKSLWDGKPGKGKTARSKWLIKLGKELPDIPFKRHYEGKIKLLLEEKISETSYIEKDLLSARFNFTTTIDGNDYSYRELLGQKSTKAKEALLKESEQLINNGFSDLIRGRNNQAEKEGYQNYWYYKNSTFMKEIEQFLIDEDRKTADLNNINSDNISLSGHSINFDEALEFYCSYLFAETEIPKIKMIIRTGDKSPPGSPFVQPLSYNPGKGHTIGINLPFIHNNHFNTEKLGTLFHELTHLFHFAAVDSRGGYSFPPELAGNNLLYESEALCYQSLLLSSWEKGSYTADRALYKDLIYIAETERQLYSLRTADKDSIRKLLYRRLETHYPAGNFKRTPFGASHLISEESAGRYWIYGGAHFLAEKRINQIISTENFLSPPYFWSEGNEAAWRIKPENQLNNKDKNILFSGNPINPCDLKKRNSVEIRKEITKNISFTV
ncbi:MAG: hypothetical protein L3J12_06645 [Spirochaetales bacterium]|nr:hypothetical protein [Spirochaetales bacterium]